MTLKTLVKRWRKRQIWWTELKPSDNDDGRKGRTTRCECVCMCVRVCLCVSNECTCAGRRLLRFMCHRRASLLARCAQFWKMTKTVYWIKLPAWWHGQLPPVVGVANGHINTVSLCVCVSSPWLTARKAKQNDKFPAASLLRLSLISCLLSPSQRLISI